MNSLFVRRNVKVLISILLFFVFFGCSVRSNKTIIRMQKMEEGVSSPTTEAELKDAIKKYQDRVNDIQLANAQVGIWYKILATRYLDSKMYGEALKNFQIAIQYYPENQNFHISIELGFQTSKESSVEFIRRCYENSIYIEVINQIHKIKFKDLN